MINMDNLFVIIDKALEMCRDVHGLDIMDTDDNKEKATVRSEKAEVSRKLLELADLFSLAESAVRNEYWYFKGRGLDVEIGVYEDGPFL